MAISTIRLQSLQSDSNLHKKTTIFTIWQQFLQSDCNLHNRTAIYTIRLQCRRIAVWLLRLQSDCWDCSLILELSQNQKTWNRGFPLVESPKSRPLIGWEDRIWKTQGISLSYRNVSHSTHSRSQSSQSDCNIYNQTAIFIIRLQSPQTQTASNAIKAINAIIAINSIIAINAINA